MSRYADTLNVEAFRDKIEHALQKTMPVSRRTVTTQGLPKGDSVYFPVVGKSGGMHERAGDGEFPWNTSVNSRVKCSLVLKAVKDQLTREDVQASQVDAQNAVIQSQKYDVAREFDSAITTAMDGTTTTDSTSSKVTLDFILDQISDLIAANVPNDGQIFWQITPKFWAHMLQIEGVTSADFVESRLLPKAPNAFFYAGCNFIINTELPSVGTSSAKTFLYHKACVGHAVAETEQMTDIEWHGADKRWVISSDLYHGAVVIQNEGVREITYDDTATS